MELLTAGKVTQKEAGKILAVSVRQIKRILRRYRTLGLPGLISKKRGRISNRRVDETIRTTAIKMIGERGKVGSRGKVGAGKVGRVENRLSPSGRLVVASKFNYEAWRQQWEYVIQKHLSSRRYSRSILVANGRRSWSRCGQPSLNAASMTSRSS